jgi:hypothetical protein
VRSTSTAPASSVMKISSTDTSKLSEWNWITRSRP